MIQVTRRSFWDPKNGSLPVTQQYSSHKFRISFYFFLVFYFIGFVPAIEVDKLNKQKQRACCGVGVAIGCAEL